MGEEELQQFQAIIDMENPDLFRWLTGQTPVPEDVRAHMRTRPRMHTRAAGLPLTRARCCHRATCVSCAQVGNPLLVRLIGDLNDAMEPKVTVASAKAFEGKVWE